jgi:AraC-like DNA-binding protein
MIDEKKCLQFNQRFMTALRNDFPIIANNFSIFLVMAHVTIDSEPATTGWHTHKYFELGIPIDNQMTYQTGTINNCLSIDEPFYVLIPAGLRHLRKTSEPDSSCLGLVIDIQSASDAAMCKLIHAIKQLNFRLTASSESYQLLEQIKKELNSSQQAFTGTMLFLQLHQFLLELLRYNISSFFYDEPAYRNENELLDIIERYLTNNLYAKNLLDALTKLCGVSIRHLNRVFRRKHGISINKFVIRERLKSASQMLLNSDDSIKTIALECGFNNFSYFTRQFRAHYDSSPSEYRNRG